MKQMLKTIAKKSLRPTLFSPDFDESVRRAVQPLMPGAVRDGLLESLRTGEAQGALRQAFLWHDPLSGGSRVDKGTQILLALKYQEMARAGLPLPSFADVGFRTFSQFDEDGILLFLFALVGMKTRKAVEICCGVGYECNSANLIIHHGFHALLFDGNQHALQLAWDFFTTQQDTCICPPELALIWVEADTIDEEIRSRGFTGEVDLLSIDLDGIDYWVLEAITCIQPRILVVEYHPDWGPDEPMTVPNLRRFVYSSEKLAFCGASLAAFDKLARRRGYRLVGCNRNRLNAFFVRNGLADDLLPAVPVASCLDHPRLDRSRATYRPIILQQTDWVAV